MNRNELVGIIKNIFEGLENNNFARLGRPNTPMWEEPLVGVTLGEDPYYDFLKEHIGEFHWSPKEVFELKYKEEVEAKNLRVISMVFPQTEETKLAQRKADKCPSKEWIVSRGEWEGLMREFSGKLVAELKLKGIRSVSIDLQSEFKRETSKALGVASRWSHRHSAYAAGLGTFGLSDGLITEKGKAIRITSLIIEANLEPTPRTYTNHNEWCLFYKDGSCGVCVDRCPTEAITKKGHDKEKCGEYEDICEEKYWPSDLEKGNYIFGCGLCQVGIPCQSKRP